MWWNNHHKDKTIQTINNRFTSGSLWRSSASITGGGLPSSHNSLYIATSSATPSSRKDGGTTLSNDGWGIWNAIIRRLYVSNMQSIRERVARVELANTTAEIRNMHECYTEKWGAHTRIFIGLRINMKCFPFFIRSPVRLGRRCFAMCYTWTIIKRAMNNGVIINLWRYALTL